MLKIYIIDRFEGNYAVCEAADLSMTNVERSKLPSEAKEGDTIIYDGEVYTIDEDDTNRRRERIKRKFNSLKKK